MAAFVVGSSRVSAIGFQLSAFGFRLSAFGFRLFAIRNSLFPRDLAQAIPS
jgi:hypothetical protein